MDSWSYGTSVFLPNGTTLPPCDSFPENPRSIAEFQQGLSSELDKDDVNGFSAVSITKVASSSCCVVPSSLLHVEENQSSSSYSKLSRIDFKLRSFMDYSNYDGGKKTRASSSCYQNPLCQVYGCNMDLSSSKDYHKRHRVCETHSKTSVVIVNGAEQRFCQLCSRFHFLSEFDDGKRSCRRRLAGHNERRRKPSFYFLPGKQRHKLLPQGRLVSFSDEPSGVSSIWDLHEAAPPRSTNCAHSLLSAHQSQQQHLSETPNRTFSITQPNQTLNASRIEYYHQMQPPFWTDHGKTKTRSSSTVDLLQLSSHLKRIEQQQINFTNIVKHEYNNEFYFPSS